MSILFQPRAQKIPGHQNILDLLLARDLALNGEGALVADLAELLEDVTKQAADSASEKGVEVLFKNVSGRFFGKISRTAETENAAAFSDCSVPVGT